MRKEIEKIILEVKQLLEENKEWASRYDGYLNDLNKHRINQKECRAKFRVFRPLSCYSSISKATKGKAEFDLRYQGQNVATVFVDNTDIVKFTPKDKNNKKYFGCNMAGEHNWVSKKGTEFRRHFTELASNTRTKSPEHALESSLLVEFAKKTSETKTLRGIQPIKLNNDFFQMPTPLKASTDSITYADHNGGGIDIMARVRMVNNDVRLTIFELKDENEPVEKVIKQAIAYSVFVTYLLNHNPLWWNEFKFNNEPLNRDKKVINVATLMPPNLYSSNKAQFENMIFEIGNGYKLELHTLFYDKNKSEFSGSLTENMLIWE